MDEETKDVNDTADITPKEVEESPSAEEAKPEEEKTSPPKEEKSVPYSRFKEVNDKMRDMEETVKALQDKKKEEGLSPEEEKELQAKQYLKKLTRETFEEIEKESKDQETKEQAKFDSELEQVLEDNPEIKKGELLKFVEDNSEKYGFKSLEGAVNVYKDIKSTAENTRKEIIKKPGMPQHEGATKDYTPPAEDKSRSFAQIVQDALKGFTDKK